MNTITRALSGVPSQTREHSMYNTTRVLSEKKHKTTDTHYTASNFQKYQETSILPKAPNATINHPRPNHNSNQLQSSVVSGDSNHFSKDSNLYNEEYKLFFLKR